MRYVQLNDTSYQTLLKHFRDYEDDRLLEMFTKKVLHYQETGCSAPHTDFQPVVWNCPKCGADEESFIIEDFDEDAFEDCNLLHKKDYVKCSRCQSVWTGTRVATALKKKLVYDD